MRKGLRKLLVYSLIINISALYFLTPLTVRASSNANNLAELREELARYQAQKASAEANRQRTQEEINNAKAEINNSQYEIGVNREKIEEAKENIVKLNKEIEETKAKIEEIMRQYEISNGDNTYLEYIFNAKSISDFIVRYSVSEQLASYNDKLVNNYKSKVIENERLQKELAEREVELNKQIENLNSAIDSLGNDMSYYIDESVSADADIATTQQLINQYEAMGCGEYDDFVTCAGMLGDTGFSRPLTAGTITSPFGSRIDPLTGAYYSFHSGVDIGGNAEGTPVYASANGMVGKILYRESCGGNQVFIYHNINGVQYTTGYLHLLTINVELGEYVTNQTVIGSVGGGWGTWSYETCSTGAHLHFMIGYGWYGSTYVAWSTWFSNLIDPESMVYFPPEGVFFFSRYY